ncbi:orotidine-5'-phosphate decarboxylase [Poriferisphaera sp. WC338]|uniref:orotidine-5'-phosphate decarboxylase n=1 Tax=Poriferisphaera sp. WC338 TaxID=3425129 RepID=UPI003D814FEF
MTDSQNHFADRFYQAIAIKGAPVCVGLDPVFDRMPDELILGQSIPADDQQAADVFEAYCMGVLEAVAPYCPIVKPQLACFERYHGPGFTCYHRVVQAAKSLGILVLADGKRGDIGTSSAHYAAGLLGAPDGADALTVNPYLGIDGIEPFAKVAAEQGKGLFALVRTSNPGGDALQTQKLADGRTVSEMVADLIADFGASEPNFVGQCGDSLLGAVVGATKSKDGAALRARMPQQIFLVPGFGAQGGTADDVMPLFKADGTGAIITASRSVIYAYSGKDGVDWKQAIADAAKDLRDQIKQIIA